MWSVPWFCRFPLHALSTLFGALLFGNSWESRGHSKKQWRNCYKWLNAQKGKYSNRGPKSKILLCLSCFFRFNCNFTTEILLVSFLEAKNCLINRWVRPSSNSLPLSLSLSSSAWNIVTTREKKREKKKSVKKSPNHQWIPFFLTLSTLCPVNYVPGRVGSKGKQR